jgi:hypothetical protein
VKDMAGKGLLTGVPYSFECAVERHTVPVHVHIHQPAVAFDDEAVAGGGGIAASSRLAGDLTPAVAAWRPRFSPCDG